MSDFLAEARIVVRPDTTAFRATLEAELRAITAKPIAIPVVAVAGSGVASLTAETAALNAANTSAVVSTQALAAAQEKEAITAHQAAAAQASHARSMSQLVRGGGASLLTLFGLRGATLAASGAFLAGTAAVVGFSKAVKSAADLETELNVFRATAGATAVQMQEMSDRAKELGRDITLPGVTANRAAEAMTELAKAGLSVADSLAAARGTLQLATAAQIDNIQATGLVAGALNSFNLAGSEAVKVADLLTGSAKESQGEISDMGTALAQAAAVSKQFGVSIEDTVTLLTQLAKAGLSGGRAGTSLRVAFLRLVNPPAAAAKALKELNVQIRDAAGNLRPQIFTDIQKALEGYTKAQQDAKLATIFGSDAIRTAGIIGNQGAGAFLATRDAVTEAGLAQQLAAARTQGLAGDIENLSNQASSLGLTIGEVARGPISTLVNDTAGMVSALNTAATAVVDLGDDFKDLQQDIKDSIPFFEQLREPLKLLSDLANLPTPKGQIGFLGDLSLGLRKLNEQAEDFTGLNFALNPTFKQARKDVQELFAELNKAGGGPVAFNETVVALQKMQKNMAGGSREAQAFAKELVPVIENLQKLSTQDTITLPVELPASLTDGTAGLKAARATDLSFSQYMRQADFGINAFVKAWGIAGTDAGNAAAAALSAAIRSGVRTSVRGAGQQAGLEDLMNQILIGGGSTQGQLANLERQAENQRRIISAAVKGLQGLTSQDKGFATLTKAARAAREKLVQILNAQKTIRNQVASDIEKAQSDAAQARSKAEQSILSGQDLARDRLGNLIVQASQTKTLQDDIKRQQQLKALVLKQIAQVRERISLEGGRAEAIVALDAILKDITGKIKSLVAEQQAAALEQRRSLVESASLDVELAKINENTDAEVKARKALIVRLKAQQALVVRGTVEWKRLRNQIAEQNAAIAAVSKEKQKQRQSFAQASFEFLQAQQGFASNLLGNLIPRGATGGLVGGTQAQVSTALTPVAGAAEARLSSGPTAGQGNTTNAILQRILDQLKLLNGGQAAPEAQYQWRTQRNTMDGVGGG